MQFFTAVVALAAAIPSLATAAPTAAGKPSGNPNDYKQYYLKTKLIDGTGPSRFDGLYVESYHTGAGFSDATLSKTKKYSPPAFLNGTRQLFKLDEGKQPYYPWGMYLFLETEYTAWQPAEINTGYGDSGFFINSTGLQNKNKDVLFGGWKVCDWWHQGTPQLFYKFSFYENYKQPSSCADVYLMPEYI